MCVYIAPKIFMVGEMGYLPFDQVGATMLFQLVSARYDRGSIILTSNKGFGEWREIFGDPIIATAILDRLLHHSHIVNIRGDSYRLREKKRPVWWLVPVPDQLSQRHMWWVTFQPAKVGEFSPGLDKCADAGVGDLRAAVRTGWQFCCYGIHRIYQRIDRLAAEVLLAAPDERICLVDEQDPTEGLADLLAGLLGRVTDVLPHQVGAFDLYQVALGQDAHFLEHLAHQAGDSGLAGARIAAEHHVQHETVCLQPGRLPPPLDLDVRGEFPHKRLHLPQADEFVQRPQAREGCTCGRGFGRAPGLARAGQRWSRGRCARRHRGYVRTVLSPTPPGSMLASVFVCKQISEDFCGTGLSGNQPVAGLFHLCRQCVCGWQALPPPAESAPSYTGG